MDSVKTRDVGDISGHSAFAGARETPRSGMIGQLQLSEYVAMHLRERIISGQLAQGEFLRIDAVASSLGVSTTPVREGLLLLQSESSVRLIPRRGFVVNGFAKDDLYDLFWTQATLGAELAARATLKMSKADIARLEDIQAEHEDAYAAGDTARAARSGHEFHRAINLAAQAPRLAQLLGRLTKQLPNRFYATIDGQLKDAVESHPVILGAMRARDADSVRSLMYRHVQSGGEHLIDMLERQGMWKSEASAKKDTSPPKPDRSPRAKPARKAARKRQGSQR